MDGVSCSGDDCSEDPERCERIATPGSVYQGENGGYGYPRLHGGLVISSPISLWDVAFVGWCWSIVSSRTASRSSPVWSSGCVITSSVSIFDTSTLPPFPSSSLHCTCLHLNIDSWNLKRKAYSGRDWVDMPPKIQVIEYSYQPRIIHWPLPILYNILLPHSTITYSHCFEKLQRSEQHQNDIRNRSGQSWNHSAHYQTKGYNLLHFIFLDPILRLI